MSSNTKAIPGARTPAEAVALLSQMVAFAGHHFWHDSISIADGTHRAFSHVVAYRQVTDAHLLSLAMAHEGLIATFDRGVCDLVPTGSSPESAVLVIP